MLHEGVPALPVGVSIAQLSDGWSYLVSGAFASGPVDSEFGSTIIIYSYCQLRELSAFQDCCPVLPCVDLGMADPKL